MSGRRVWAITVCVMADLRGRLGEDRECVARSDEDTVNGQAARIAVTEGAPSVPATLGRLCNCFSEGSGC